MQSLATKIAQLNPESQDGVISGAEFRIKKNIEEALDKNWQNRMEKEERSTSANSRLNSMVTRLEAEVLNLKGKYSNISQQILWPLLPRAVVAVTLDCSPRVLRANVCRRASKSKGGAFGGEFVKLVLQWMRLRTCGQGESTYISIHHEKFDWDMISKDQGFFEIKMAVFLWFKEDVTLCNRRLAQMDRSSLTLFACRGPRGENLGYAGS